MSGIAKQLQKLIVEKTEDGFWGRADINNNLITDYAPFLDSLKKQMKKLIYEIENIEVAEFDVSYDLTSFFEQYSFLNISDIAKRTSINSTLMRQYAAGIKFPSIERVQNIEEAIRTIGRELAKVKLHSSFRNRYRETDADLQLPESKPKKKLLHKALDVGKRSGIKKNFGPKQQLKKLHSKSK